MRILQILSLSLVFSLLSGCGYNAFQELDEEVNANGSEILNQYQRRSDLIPNLVSVVKGYAAHEKETLTGVTEARAKAMSVQMSPEMLNNPEAFAKYQQAQSQVTMFLGRMMMMQERYPELKANEQFIALQAQIEGTENRITVARKRYIDSVKDYNMLTRQFPTNFTAKMFDYAPRPQFSVDNVKEISVAPKVAF
jgi:LemA protein